MSATRDVLYRMIRRPMVIVGLILTVALGVQDAALASVTPISETNTAAPTDQRMCRQSPEITCTVAAHVKRFKAGKFGRVHGIHVRVFASAAAKDAMMLKLARKMPLKPLAAEKKATCAKAPKWACSKGRAATRGGIGAAHARCMQSDLCRAYNRYGAMASGVTCIGVDSSWFHPSCIPYKLQNPGWEGFTKKQVQIGGTIGLCGASVVASYVTRGKRADMVFGGSTCAWGFWRDVDPG